MKYTFEFVSSNKILSLTLTGNLIGEEIDSEFLDVINDAINQKTLFCAINISDVRYINSSGIGVLITILTKFRNKGGEVFIVNPSEHVKKLLIVTKLTSLFQIVDTDSEAIQQLKQLAES